MNDFYNCLQRLAPCIELPVKIENELLFYKNAMGAFALQITIWK